MSTTYADRPRTPAPAPAADGEWLRSWDPENPATWDKGLAWRTLWISTFTLTLCFASWFLASARLCE